MRKKKKGRKKPPKKQQKTKHHRAITNEGGWPVTMEMLLGLVNDGTMLSASTLVPLWRSVRRNHGIGAVSGHQYYKNAQKTTTPQRKSTVVHVCRLRAINAHDNGRRRGQLVVAAIHADSRRCKPPGNARGQTRAPHDCKHDAKML
jgi:hypothetical protein